MMSTHSDIITVQARNGVKYEINKEEAKKYFQTISDFNEHFPTETMPVEENELNDLVVLHRLAINPDSGSILFGEIIEKSEYGGTTNNFNNIIRTKICSLFGIENREGYLFRVVEKYRYNNLSNKKELFQYLIKIAEIGDLRRHNAKGETLLTAACSTNEIEIVEILMSKMDVSLCDLCNNTPLISAISGNYPQLTEKLIEGGADPNKINDENCHPLIVAISNNNIDIINFLIKRGADVNYKFNDNSTILDKLSKYSSVNFNKINTIDLNLNEKNDKGRTFLMRACMTTNSGEYIKYIIRLGCKVNEQDTKGKTALMYACKYNCDIKSLIQAGANLNIQNNQGKTALMYACKSGNCNAEYLIGQGSNICIEDNYGKMAIDYAVNLKDIKLLIKIITV